MQSLNKTKPTKLLTITMDDRPKSLQAEVSKLIKWDAETSLQEEELEIQLKAAEEQEASQEVTQHHLLQERDRQKKILRESKHAR